MVIQTMVLSNALARRYVGFVLILLLAFGLRLWDLNARSLWFDEAVEYWSADAPLWALPKTVLIARQPPLYTYLLHLWLTLGMEALSLRFLSVALSMLTIVGIVTWAKRQFGLTGALVAGGITAVLPSEIRYAQEVGEYALMICVLVWSLNTLDVTSKHPRWRFLGLWGLLSVASVYSHYGTSIVVIPLTAIVLVENLRNKRYGVCFQQTTVAAISLILGLPLILFFLPQQIQIPNHNAFSVPVLSLSEIVSFIDSVDDTFLFPLTGWPFSNLPTAIGGLFTGVIGVLFVFIFLAPFAQVPKRVLWWLLVAYVTYFAAVRSGLYAYGNYGFRYALILTPLFILAITAIIEQLTRWRQMPIALVLLSIVAGLGVYSLPNRTIAQLTRGEHIWPETQDMREVTRYWIEHRTHLQPTYVYYGAVPAFRYYLRLYGLDTAPLPPGWFTLCWGRRTEPACSMDNIFYGEWFRARAATEMRLSMEKAFGSSPQYLWLIFSHVYPGEEDLIIGQLLGQYIVALEHKRTGASAYLLERR